MGKLSQNIVPNVYNSLQSSFLSLDWPWPGRPLPRGTSGSAETLDWGPMWGAPSPLATPIHPDTATPPDAPNNPLHHIGAPKTPDAPIPLLAPEYLESMPAPNTPLTPHNSTLHPLGAPMPLYAFCLLSTYSPCQSPIDP